MKKAKHRSACAIAFGLDIFGDKWSLIIVRDIALRGKVSYGDFLKSEEKIATNILASRLVSLETSGIISKKNDPSDKRREYYSLTKKGTDLLPVLLEMLIWGAKYFSKNKSPKWFVAQAKKDKKTLIDQIEFGVKSGKYLLKRD